jgi:uncharacterized membrane protein YkvA (DUF1232 family)
MPTSPESPKRKAAAAKAAGKSGTSKTAAAKKAGGDRVKATARMPKSPPQRTGKPAAKSASTSKATTAKTTTPKATTPKTTAAAKKKAASATRSRYWAKAQQRARRLLRSKDELLDIVKQGDRVAAKLKSGPMSRLIEELKASLRLIRAYASGEYRQVSWESMVLIVAAVLYVVSPIDVIPDFIPVIGYLDDVTVVSFALRIVREELDEFIAWERQTGRAPKGRRSPA